MALVQHAHLLLVAVAYSAFCCCGSCKLSALKHSEVLVVVGVHVFACSASSGEVTNLALGFRKLLYKPSVGL